MKTMKTMKPQLRLFDTFITLFTSDLADYRTLYLDVNQEGHFRVTKEETVLGLYGNFCIALANFNAHRENAELRVTPAAMKFKTFSHA